MAPRPGWRSHCPPGMHAGGAGPVVFYPENVGCHPLMMAFAESRGTFVFPVSLISASYVSWLWEQRNRSRESSLVDSHGADWLWSISFPPVLLGSSVSRWVTQHLENSSAWRGNINLYSMWMIPDLTAPCCTCWSSVTPSPDLGAEGCLLTVPPALTQNYHHRCTPSPALLGGELPAGAFSSGRTPGFHIGMLGFLISNPNSFPPVFKFCICTWLSPVSTISPKGQQYARMLWINYAPANHQHPIHPTASWQVSSHCFPISFNSPCFSFTFVNWCK